MGTNKNVLLVGAGGALLEGADGPLHLSGIEIRRVATGAEAHREHRARSANLIAMELDLPDMSAEGLCEAIRGDEPSRRVALVVLCAVDEASRRRAADCEANAQFVSSEDAESLAVELARLLAVPPRAKYRVLARLSVDDDERSFFCTSDNVSPTGMLVETDEVLVLGQTVDCSFFLPGRFRVATQGRVVREASGDVGRRFGIQFLDLPQQETARLESFVTSWRNPR